MPRRIIIGLIAAAAVFSVTFGFAATLGGLSTSSLGAADSAVSSCDSDGVSASYSLAYDDVDKTFEVGTVSVSGIHDDCDGMTLYVTVSDADGTALVSTSAAIPTSTDTSLSLSLATAVAAASVANVHVAIS